jgi:adenylate cyclase class 2
MAIETEIKLQLGDPERFRRVLKLAGATLLSPRHFEDNYVFDFPKNQLRSRGCLLRVRVTPTRSVLTYKGPAQAAGPFKSREELEMTVENAPLTMKIFEKLGLHMWFHYQKFREEYAVPVKTCPEPAVHVALDQTPLGFYAELEGLPESIRVLAAQMGFEEGDFIRDSYYSLYLQSCERRGIGPGNMVFERGD